VPGAGKAAPRAEVGNLEREAARRLGAEGFQRGDLGAQARAALGQRGGRVEARKYSSLTMYST
jgi:hypothetical protein